VVGEITGFIGERVEGPCNPAPDTDLSEGIPKPLKYPYLIANSPLPRFC